MTTLPFMLDILPKSTLSAGLLVQTKATTINANNPLGFWYNDEAVMQNWKPEPLDPRKDETLTEQLADQIRVAIRRGELRSGDLLPGIDTLARHLRTSWHVPRTAFKILKAEGLIETRRRRGCCVAGRLPAPSPGTVLIVIPGGNESYFMNVAVGEIERKLLSAHCHVIRSVAVRNVKRGFDLQFVRQALKTQPNIVVAMSVAESILKTVEASGLPFVTVGYRPHGHPNSVGNVLSPHQEAVPDFVAHCVERKIKSVLQVRLVSGLLDVSRHLASVGIETETLNVQADPDKPFLTSILEDALRLVSNRIEKCRLPELMFFTDDYVARGGIIALLEHGFRIPLDVGLVTCANVGNEPILSIPITKMEASPLTFGDDLARGILAYLKTHQFPTGITNAYRYVRGETFS